MAESPSQPPLSAPTLRPAPKVTTAIDSLKKEYDALAAQVANANPGDTKYPDLRAKKKAAWDAYWTELHKK